MQKLERDEAGKKWDQLWQGMTKEWFKVEVLQDYSGEDAGESLDAWMAGDKERSIQLMKAWTPEWANECRAKVEQGVKLTRIHVVDYPLSDYVQWEIEVYKNRNIPMGGEDVYLLDRKDISGIDLPAGDLMIFDKKYVVVNEYDDNGRMTSETFHDESDSTFNDYFYIQDQLLGSSLQKVQ